MPDDKPGIPAWSAGQKDDPRLKLIFGDRRGYLEPGHARSGEYAPQAENWPTAVNDDL